MANPIPPDNATFLAFDFGTKNIGVAVGQMITQTATPLSSLQANKGIPNWKQIENLIEQWRPDSFIVGIPYNMDGTEQTITAKARQFAETLKKYHLPVYEMDERLTTVEAKQMLFDLGGYRALKETSVDSFAAKLILESWMQAGKNEK